jgi:hypothetical protein
MSSIQNLVTRRTQISFFSIWIIDLREKNPLHRNRKSAWSRDDRLDSDLEETTPVGAETCGYGGDGGDGEDDGGC